VTALREINTLLKCPHVNIVKVQEILVGDGMEDVFICMEFVQHDLKGLIETMKHPFLQGEVKCLMKQLLSGVHHMHDNWLLHRDLKTSNLLLSHTGILKIADFGLAREYGSPLKNYTPLVVTLWYRPPELLLGATEYSTAVDMWSVGCIMAEFLTGKALFPATSEMEAIQQIFKLLGTPNEKIWKGYSDLPNVKRFNFKQHPYNNLGRQFEMINVGAEPNGLTLLKKMLFYDPKARMSARDALFHEWFEQQPLPVHPEDFPTWPAKSEGESTRRRAKSPSAPQGNDGPGGDDVFSMEGQAMGATYSGAAAFTLKFH